MLVVGFALVGTGVAMLIGTFANNADQAGSLGVFVGHDARLPGRRDGPDRDLRRADAIVAHLTPHAWAIDGFRTLVFDGAGMVQVLPQLGMLLLFAMVPLVLASWRFRRTISA